MEYYGVLLPPTSCYVMPNLALWATAQDYSFESHYIPLSHYSKEFQLKDLLAQCPP